MSAVDVFTYETHEIHTVVINDEPWFIAGDIAKTLGYRMASDLTRNLDEDEKGTHILRTPGGDQSVTVISEPGLYEAILRSRIETAQKFKRWVKHEVLPAIRKHGSYGTPAGMTFEEMTAHVIGELTQRIEDAQARARELEAPAAAWNSLANASGDFTISDASKILSRDGKCPGPRLIHDWLKDQGWIFRRGGRWQAMQSAVNAGYVVERVTSGYFDQETGERKQGTPQVRVLPRGLEKMRELLAGERGLSLVVGGAS